MGTETVATATPRRFAGTGRIVVYCGLAVGSLAAAAPFVWMLLASFMTRGETLRRVLAPESLQWSNYATAWREEEFGLYFANSLIIAALQVLGTLLFSSMAAYALARMKFRGRDVLFTIILATLMIPETVTMVPNFLTVAWLHQNSPIAWLNNWPALTVPFMVSAFSIFLLRQFMRGLPSELWDAARIDGAGHVRFLLQIVLPLCRAPLMTVGMFTFIGAWNSLGWPLLVTNTPAWRPISVALQKFVSEAGAEVQLQMAGAVIATLPVLVLYALIQREFTAGISASGLKG
jgi:ABC-type glycerol-3-phosphate transport system permease component